MRKMFVWILNENLINYVKISDHLGYLKANVSNEAIGPCAFKSKPSCMNVGHRNDEGVQ